MTNINTTLQPICCKKKKEPIKCHARTLNAFEKDNLRDDGTDWDKWNVHIGLQEAFINFSLCISFFLSCMPIQQTIFTSSLIHYICNLEMYPKRTSTPVFRSYEFKEVSFKLDLKVWSLSLKFDFSNHANKHLSQISILI